jgi:hypothetical protein
MTNKSFVLSVYDKAFCHEDAEKIAQRVRFVIYSEPTTLTVLGYSSYSNTVAWRSAARFLRLQMLEQLEK